MSKQGKRWLLPALAAVLVWSSLVGCSRSALPVAAGEDDRQPPPSPATETPGVGAGRPAAVTGEDRTKLAEGNNAFALELYARLVEANPTDNLAFSPYSLTEALGLVYRGARGDTAREMAKTLHFSLPAERLPAVLESLDQKLTRGDQARPRSSRIGLRLAESAQGLKVEEVVPNSPADKGGLKKGDLILALNDQPIRTVAEYHTLVAELPGPVIKIETRFGRNSTVPCWVTLPRPSGEENQLALATALWGRKGLTFRPDFLESARKLGAAIEDLDFARADEARATINDWVGRKTIGQLPEVLASGTLKPDTTLVVTNAVYFQGLWLRDFKPDATHPELFNGLERKLMVRMMTQLESFHLYGTDTHKILEMPIKGSTVVLDLILPAEGLPLPQFEQVIFSLDTLNKSLEKLRGMRERKVRVKLPRFRATGKIDLASMLGEMGMPEAFGRKADFSGIADDRNLAISQITHQASVTVREEGVTATAASVVIAGPKAIGRIETEETFIADRPFLFVLRDRESNAILFMGRVTEPRDR